MEGNHIVKKTLCSILLGISLAMAPIDHSARPKQAMAETLDQTLAHYSSMPLGRVMRQTQFKFISTFGDMFIYDRRDSSGTTLTLVARSYTSYKSSAMEKVRHHLDKIAREYHLDNDEAASVKSHINGLIRAVPYFRVDVRYTNDKERGAIFVYQHVDGRNDKLLGKRSISKKASLSLLHYSDRIFMKRPYIDTIICRFYKAVNWPGRLDFERR